MASISEFQGRFMAGTRPRPAIRPSFFHPGISKISFHGFQSSNIKATSDQTEACNTTFTLPLLSISEVAEKLTAFHKKGTRNQKYKAMYSSLIGGVTTDPAAMVLPVDDHMVHRGHGVFDTAAIVNGHLYELDQHLDRFLKSASAAKIRAPFDRSTIRQILIQTVSISKCTNGSLRYWLSAGPGDFQLSPKSCLDPVLYTIVIELDSLPLNTGCTVITSSIPFKSQRFATMKSVNYLPNVLNKMEAEEREAFAGIWVDELGFVMEGPSMNVGFVSKDNEFVMPSFGKILSGCTAHRVLGLVEGLVEEGRIKGVRVGDVSVKEGKESREMMLVGSGVLVKSVLKWDDKIIGDGKEGPIAKALYDLVVKDMKSGPPSVRIPVSY
ncbi:hypothetical protein LUZ60_012579 [Juncus effusus]|nr:hypothetical protein LUZ60_012579 [Juncus effusus]